MEKVKLSTLSKDTIVYVEGDSYVVEVEDILDDLDYYREEEVYTTIPHYASFNAKEILEDAIENQQCNGMYEDWECSIRDDITSEDIEELQKILDRILARNPNKNMSYEIDKLIEFNI